MKMKHLHTNKNSMKQTILRTIQVLLVSCYSICTNAQTPEYLTDGYNEYVFTDPVKNEVELHDVPNLHNCIWKYNGIPEYVEVFEHGQSNPKTYNVRVTSIGKYACKDSKGFKSLPPLFIPGSIRSIGDYAFDDCIDLTSVQLSEGLTHIGESAFRDCKNLKSINIPSTVSAIRSRTFENCTNLSNITISGSVDTVGSSAFDNVHCEKVTIEYGKNHITYEWIPNCDTLDINRTYYTNIRYYFDTYKKMDTYLSIPYVKVLITGDSIRGINSCDEQNEHLEEIFVGKNVESIRLLWRCEKLARLKVDVRNKHYCTKDNILYNKKADSLLYVPEGLTLESFEVPEGVKYIDWGCFSNGDLTSLKLPSSISSIGDYAFYNCPKLVKLEVDINNKHYCTKDNILYNKKADSLLYVPEGLTLESFEVPEGVRFVEWTAFPHENLTSLKLPSSITSSLDEMDLYSCPKLAELEVGIENKYYSTKDNVLYNKKADSLLFAPIGLAAESLEIPEGVNVIKEKAFSNERLASITLPSSISSIGDKAFYNCSKLKSIYCKGSTPCSMEKTTCFNARHYGQTNIFVPKGSLDTYKKAPGWKNFMKIQEYDPAGIENTIVTGSTIKKADGYIIIGNTKGGISVYTLSGKMIHNTQTNGENVRINVPKGIYIVKTSEGINKIAI